MVHTRQAFEDCPKSERKGHLLRIRIFARGSRPLPSAYFLGYGDPDKVDWPGRVVGPDTVVNAPSVIN